MASKKALAEIIEHPSLDLPIYLYYGAVKNINVRLDKHKVVLTLPYLAFKKDKDKYIEWAVNWTQKKLSLEQNKTLQDVTTFSDGHVFNLMGQPLVLHLVDDYYQFVKAIAKIDNHKLQIRIPFTWSHEEKQIAVRSIAKRVISKNYLPIISERIDEINRQKFGFEIKNIRLKYNLTNWGSCSSKGNLNFSIRLLFAPLVVIDSTIIHELVHFVHMNHSKDFWALVAAKDPNLEASEAWLKANSHTDFV
jgi:predicted metal-dependent hydrolase